MTQTIVTRPTATTTAAPVRQRREVNLALWALQVVMAAVFLMAALPKLTADPQAVAGFTAIGLGETGMYVIGSLEIAGAIALLIPLLGGLAGLAFVGLMTGAVLSTLLVFGPELVVMPAIVLVLVAIIAWGRRGRSAQLLALVRNHRLKGR